MKRFTLYCFLIMGLLLGLQTQAQKSVKSKTITEKKFSRKMKQPDVVVLDVRTAEEYSSGHLPNAVLMDVQQQDFNEKIKSLPPSKTYLIYCKSGRRSEKALHIMNNQGFKKVYHLKGGYTGWKGKTTQKP